MILYFLEPLMLESVEMQLNDWIARPCQIEAAAVAQIASKAHIEWRVVLQLHATSCDMAVRKGSPPVRFGGRSSRSRIVRIHLCGN